MKTTFVGYFRHQAPMLFWFLPGLALAAIVISSIPPTTERDVLLGIIFALVMVCIWLLVLIMEAMVLRQRTRDRVGHLVYRIVHQVSTCYNPDGPGPYVYISPPVS